MKGLLIRTMTGGAVLVTMLAAAVAPASAAVTAPSMPVVSIAFPTPGTYLRRGQNWFNGTACDPNASLSDSSAGIARIQVYVGDREHPENGAPFYRPGGYFGQASLAGTTPEFSVNASETSRLGMANPDVSSGCKHQFAGWRVLPSSFRKGIIDINFYVLTKAGAEAKITIPGVRVDNP